MLLLFGSGTKHGGQYPQLFLMRSPGVGLRQKTLPRPSATTAIQNLILYDSFHTGKHSEQWFQSRPALVIDKNPPLTITKPIFSYKNIPLALEWPHPSGTPDRPRRTNHLSLPPHKQATLNLYRLPLRNSRKLFIIQYWLNGRLRRRFARYCQTRNMDAEAFAPLPQGRSLIPTDNPFPMKPV